MTLHGKDIQENLVILRYTSGFGAEFMAVNTLEYDSLSVQAHDMIFHFKTTETDVFEDDFHKLSVLIIYMQ